MNKAELINRILDIAYSVKSCRAGDGDIRSWKEAAEDCEALAERLVIYLGHKDCTYIKKGNNINDLSD